MNVRTFRVGLAMVTSLLLMASGAVAASVPHTFKLTPPGNANAVSVAGDFNDWSTTANPMTKGDDGAYTATVNLSEGTHHYKFVVDGQWLNDPVADKSLDAPDGQGGANSGVNVTASPAQAPSPAAAPAPAAPPAAGSPSHTFRYVPPNGMAATAQVFVAGDFNNWSTTTTPMTKGDDGAYTVIVAVPPGVHHYKFVVDGQWLNDPTADKSLDADDGQGGKNSGFTTAAPAAK